jgi:esterase/lipase/1-acyl-sn-glycerol-3-phosphate acyltransferase
MYQDRTLAKANQSFRFSNLVISALEKVTRSSVLVEGMENLRSNPTLFVVNHFTRMETGILPHVLYQFNGQMVHSLADSTLFVGKFGPFLESVGAYPLDLEGRNEKIISELMRGTYNWVIFPEGSMVKNKKVVEKGRLQMQLPHATRAPYTGAATLALKTFLMKQEYKRAIADNNEEVINFYQDTYSLRGPGDLAPLDLCIVPVNITYYPLRPGSNFISTFAQLLHKDLSPELEEELLVEGKLLLQESDISISFGHAIDVRSFTRPYRRLFAYLLPYLSASKKMNWLMAMMRHRLTRIFMHRVYDRLSINMDHLVATALRYVPAKGVPEATFKQVIYLAIEFVKSEHQRRVHPTLGDGCINLVCAEPYQAYDNIMKLVEFEKVACRKGGYLFIDHDKIKKKHAFHRMRLDNISSVLANEFEVMGSAVKAIKKLLRSPAAVLSSKVAETVTNRDCSLYEEERMRSFDENETKSREIGKPRHLIGKKNKPGIVLAHGFLAAPAEMLALAQYLNQRGYGVYLVRLVGHGTHPQELDSATVKNWCESFKRGYAVLAHCHSKVVVGGFSAGALLALLKGASGEEIAGIVAINPALRLHQKSAGFSPMLDRWNKAMESVSMPRGTVKWVENRAENPEINYDKIYIAGLRSFLALQSACRSKLADITTPLLVIQGSEDPLVDPSGAAEIIRQVKSSHKKLEEIVFKRHVIVNGDASLEVFKLVDKFMETI